MTAATEGTRAAPDTAPGYLQRLTTERLAVAGVPVAHAAAFGGAAQLAIGFPAPPLRGRRSRNERGAYCFLTVDDAAELNLHPWPAAPADPHWLADIAAALVTGNPGHGPCHTGTEGRDLTLKGIAGMDLRHRGFDVALGVFPDDHYFDVAAEISAAAPGSDADSGETGTVDLADDGILCWKRNYLPDHAQTGCTPFLARLPDPAVAAGISGTVAAVVRAARPVGRTPSRREAA